MTKTQKNLVFYGGTALVVVVLTLLAGQRPARYVPVDDNHPRPLVIQGCRECHAPGKMAPQSEKHPPEETCMLCHRDKLKNKN